MAVEGYRTAQQIVDEALRTEISERLAECTAEQNAFFLRLYPEGLGKMPESKLRNAVDQTQRTVAKNRAKSAA